MKSMEDCPTPPLHFPIGGAADLEHILATLEDFQIEVLAGVPTTIMKVAEACRNKNFKFIKRVLFGGEAMYPDQRETLREIFPNVQVLSIGYASVDAGLLGYADTTCGPQEHRVFSDHTILEIVDEDTGEPITTAGKKGKLVLTNLTRKLMPIIRYPVGDLGVWVEDETVQRYRKFLILGRSEEAARVGPASVYYDDIGHFLEEVKAQLQVQAFQLIIRHYEEKDELILRLAVHNKPGPATLNEVRERLYQSRPFLLELSEKNMIHPPRFELVSVSELVYQPRTGKLKRVVDERF
jgi:phenylacetate-CoA ligase